MDGYALVNTRVLTGREPNIKRYCDLFKMFHLDNGALQGIIVQEEGNYILYIEKTTKMIEVK